MNKDAVLDAIKEAQKDVERSRVGFGQVINLDMKDYKYQEMSRRFRDDLLFRNGLVYALLLSDMCDDEDMEYLRTLPNKPALWIHMLDMNPKVTTD